MIENKYLKQWLKETYPLFTEEEDLESLDGYDMDKFADWLVKLFAIPVVSVPLPDTEPILIGHLDKIFGYNGFEKIEKGAKVFSYEDRYYFEMKFIETGEIVKQKFYKESLAPCILFLGNER